MSETTRKQERDFSPEVNTLLPQAKELAQAGKVQEAVDKLLVLEKQCRNASDTPSTTRVATAILDIAKDAKDFDLLNSSLNTLSKKHGQMKNVVEAMVKQTSGWTDEIGASAGTERWLQTIETLRTVTEGKIFLETHRARVTKKLAAHHEALATSNPEKRLESLQTASDLLSDLQVETYSSMERDEKTQFILEQMRLLEAVAREKDKVAGKDSLADGEAEWVKVRVGGRKISEKFLAQKGNEYYDLMIQFSLHYNSYLDVAQYWYKVWETPYIKEDASGKGREALENIVYYVVLAPHDNEQSNMLHKLFTDPALAKLEVHYNLLKCFTTQELMRWPGIQGIYGETLSATSVFGPGNEKRWEDLHTRVIEHNIRVVSQYYTRITVTRLTQLLDLTTAQTEETLSRLVVSGTVWARIDRPSGVVTFSKRRSAEDVLNDWSSDMNKLLGYVEKTWMTMNAALAAQTRA
ncbi:PCI-domain-containing protein [Exidia glandulosa HHB12029]|uniref:PCI-domain-containing protein n=1 Tax=Exidia glandulosa HHB12029 TaxID=1314781 RepID=A0A165H1U9_EXIGL|nr:PCI-domain-containing protein [Exidia glandulosa HHB12029]